MYDRGTILPGLLIFLALITLPFWYSRVSGTEVLPELVLPVGEEQCIEEASLMRREHMQLVTQWRDEVVRSNDRVYTGSDGRRHEKSLTRTCLACHVDKAGFCDRCHDAVGVEPYCWSCHVIPEGDQV